MTPRTNHELYLAICEIARSGRDASRQAHPSQQATHGLHGEASGNPDGERSLENYLLAILGQSRAFADKPTLTVDEFLGLLSGAFSAEPLPFQTKWREFEEPDEARSFDFKTWESLVIAQIVDLREMDENGDLRNEYRYGGIDSPRGNRWYNFDPASYLECAAAGSVGGWEPGDDTGRSFVPGPCLAMDPFGNHVLANPEDVESPQLEVPADIPWAFFADFMECGQQYE
ncbi:hypothetical protein GC170_04395 [bacterium]|nr:hypothetical protein [bacterium]